MRVVRWYSGRTDIGHAVAVAEDVLDEHMLDDAALGPRVVAAGVPGVAGAIGKTCRLLLSALSSTSSGQLWYEFTLWH